MTSRLWSPRFPPDSRSPSLACACIPDTRRVSRPPTFSGQPPQTRPASPSGPSAPAAGCDGTVPQPATRALLRPTGRTPSSTHRSRALARRRARAAGSVNMSAEHQPAGVRESRWRFLLPEIAWPHRNRVWDHRRRGFNTTWLSRRSAPLGCDLYFPIRIPSRS